MSSVDTAARDDVANGSGSIDGMPAPILDARPETLSATQLLDACEGTVRRIAALLRHDEPDAAWVQALEAVTTEIEALALAAPDTALYALVQGATNNAGRYSAHHAALCAIVTGLCARSLGWPVADARCILKAALTMNLSMAALQDTLARQAGPVSQAQRSEIDQHGVRSAEMLARAGVADPLWLEVVRCHHEPGAGPGEGRADGSSRVAGLLNRVDIYTAKLSRRTSREAVTPSIAARDVCLGFGGVPDEVGATILRTLGLFPPGSFVELANGELGVVASRGGRAHTPVVVALRRGDGGVHLQPVRRDTTEPHHAILRGVSRSSVSMRLDHGRILNRSFVVAARRIPF